MKRTALLLAIAMLLPQTAVFAQGNARPFGAGGPSLNLGNLAPLATTRSWSPILFLKYFFFDAQTKLRPFVGIGGALFISM